MKARKVEGAGQVMALPCPRCFAAVICCRAAWEDLAAGSQALKSLLITLRDGEITWAFVTGSGVV